MTGNFFESETKENLMRAFAGESQARNRYTIAAEKAREKGMYTIADVFLYTADQERAHAERFYELLKEFTGSTIQISRMLSTPLFEAASISITFIDVPAAIERHIAHSPQGLPFPGCSQLTAFAKIFATVVLPVPLVPQNR